MIKAAQYFYSIYDTKAKVWFIRYKTCAGWTSELEGRCLFASREKLIDAVKKAGFSKEILRRKDDLTVHEYASIITDISIDSLDALYKSASGHTRVVRQDARGIYLQFEGKIWRPNPSIEAYQAELSKVHLSPYARGRLERQVPAAKKAVPYVSCFNVGDRPIVEKRNYHPTILVGGEAWWPHFNWNPPLADSELHKN